jgi:hypothetical protein
MRSNSFKERPVGFKRHFPETATGNFDTQDRQDKAFTCSREVHKSFDRFSPRLAQVKEEPRFEQTPQAYETSVLALLLATPRKR